MGQSGTDVASVIRTLDAMRAYDAPTDDDRTDTLRRIISHIGDARYAARITRQWGSADASEPSRMAYAHTFERMTSTARMIMTIDPDRINDPDARDWYRTMAPSFVRSVVARHGACCHVTVARVSAIVAVFSSTMVWSQNMIAATRIIDAWHDGARGTDLPGVTRNYECIRKAEAILAGDHIDPIDAIVQTCVKGKMIPDHMMSHKTRTFYRNIMGSFECATIDVWMVRALFGSADIEYRPSGWHYRLMEDVVITFASEYGIDPASMQAVLWTIIRGSAD